MDKTMTKSTANSTTQFVDRLKSAGSKTLGILQKIGKSMVFPIACLPAAALFLRIGAAIQTAGSNNSIEVIYWIGYVMSKMGGVVFDYLPAIFAVGVGFGFSKDHRGEAALVSFLAYLLITALVQGFSFAGQTAGAMDKNSAEFYKTQPGSMTLTSLIYHGALVNDGGVSSLLYLTVSYYDPQAAEMVYNNVWLMNLGVFGGIMAGLIGAWTYNKYSSVQLHPALGFFSGRRFTPLAVLFFAMLWSWPIAIVWPWINWALIQMSEALVNTPATAAGLYAFLNRLLIPFGLHQVLNAYFWFQMPIVTSGAVVIDGFTVAADGTVTQVTDVTISSGTQLFYWEPDTTGQNGDADLLPQITPVLGDLNAFLSASGGVNIAAVDSTGQLVYFEGDASYALMQSAHVGTYQTGFFPVMMFGLPAVGIGIAYSADKQYRKQVLMYMGTAAIVSFLTGITEPLEFAFMFISPALYFGYALLSGLVAGFTVATGASFGFGFSAGLIDFALSIQTAANLSTGVSSAWNGYASIFWVLFMGIICVPAYFFMTVGIIKYTDVATPGRNGNLTGITGNDDNASSGVTASTIAGAKNAKDAKNIEMAQATMKLVGPENLLNIDNCITRVRLKVKDNKSITNEQAAKIGYRGMSKPGSENLQFIIGPESEQIAIKMQAMYDEWKRTGTLPYETSKTKEASVKTTSSKKSTAKKSKSKSTKSKKK